MYTRKKTKKFRNVIVVLLAIYFGYTMYNLYGVLNTKKAEYNTVLTKINQEEEQKDILEKQKKIENSDEYIEKIAREKLGLVKKGEKVFIDIN
jgi:cell division protein FtsB